MHVIARTKFGRLQGNAFEDIVCWVPAIFLEWAEGAYMHQWQTAQSLILV